MLGRKLKDWKGIDLYRGNLAMLPQDPQNLFVKKTVRADLLEMLTDFELTPEEEQARLAEISKLCDIEYLLDTHPFDLSGGEQQRIAIARALLNHPDLILADEPTGNLDPETSNEIMTVLKQVALENGAAVVMATHDYHMIQNFPGEAIRCEDGKVSVLDTAELFE